MSTDPSRPRAKDGDDASTPVPNDGGSALDEAAAQGPLPGIAAEDAAQQRGEDHSGDNEPRTGRGLFSFLRPRN